MDESVTLVLFIPCWLKYVMIRGKVFTSSVYLLLFSHRVGNVG